MPDTKKVNVELSVVLTPDGDGGYVVSCPAIPGCISEGNTEEEALSHIREAIELCDEDASGQL